METDPATLPSSRDTTMMVGGVVSVIQTFSVSPGPRTTFKQVCFQQGAGMTRFVWM